MLKNKFGKKAVAAVMAAAMTVSATAMGLSSITASAAATGFEEFGAGTFNDGVGLPWHICESATGTMKFEVANGCYNILITNPGGLSNNGEGRWDCQRSDHRSRSYLSLYIFYLVEQGCKDLL